MLRLRLAALSRVCSIQSKGKSTLRARPHPAKLPAVKESARCFLLPESEKEKHQC